jgi:hypothetical protein
MTGAIPPFHNKPSWRVAQLKRRDNFIDIYTHSYIRSRARTPTVYFTVLCLSVTVNPSMVS